MTFCLGITVDQGLVGIADTRLLSGNESLVGRKTATYQGPGFSFFVMNSGLRSLRDKVLLNFEEAFVRATECRDRLSKVADLFARQVRIMAEHERAALENSYLKFNIYSLIGGQMSDDSTHRLFLVYPEGNWVEVGPDTPYQIIGASGFGKPILERSVTRADSMSYAFKVGILAFDATRLCAADVDFPIDVLLYQAGSFEMIEHRYERNDLSQISNWWQDRMRRAVQELPSEWVDRAFSKLTAQASA
ncbi:MAG TPA: peptidase [Bryobacteraceae bacterium]|jgi:putative proteasome-type protease|nr:peptidase [Bryobacteraceae bacterium]